MPHILDCKPYWGGCWMVMQTYMCMEESMAVHSRQCQLTVTKQLSQVWLLLEKDTDVNVQGGENGSTLYVALAGGHKAVVWLKKKLK